jgi:Glycosyltransferase
MTRIPSPSGCPRVIFVNRFFWPDISATSQVLTDVAFALAANNVPVEIVASRLAYGNPCVRYSANEYRHGVRIHRVATTGFGRAGLWGRAIDYLSFYVSALVKAALVLRKGDVLVVKTDPPLLSVPMRLVAWARGARQINWLQDVYPEIAGLLGFSGFGGTFGRLLAHVRDRSLNASAANVVIGEGMRARLRARGIADSRLTVIENFTDDEAITPLSTTENTLRAEWNYRADTLVVGYSGNLGQAHDLNTMLSAAMLLHQRGRSDIRFLFVGGGAFFADVQSFADTHGLTNIDSRPYQPRERLSESLTAPDIHWISLRPEVEGYLLPSKFYGVLAAGRPTIFIGSPDGEIARILKVNRCGWCFAVGDSAGIADWLCALAADRAAVEQAGVAARRLMDSRYKRRQIIGKWERLLDELR